MVTDSIFLRKIGLSNYKSIKTASVSLGPLTFLVGQNGAGKSNFLDAPRLVAEALNTSLEHALRERGGINEVRRRSSGHPTHFGIRLDWRLPDGTQGIYVFRVGAQPKGGFEVQQEMCRVYRDDQIVEACYRIENGQHVSSSDKVWPPIARDRLYLVAAAGLPEFRPLYNGLSHMGFYNLNPDSIRELQPPDPGAVLKRDGSNLASVLGVLEKQAPGSFERIVEYLSRVVPGIDGIVVRQLGKKETIEFLQKVGTNRDPWRFMAENMSDGTLRALGVLTALFQSSNGGPARVPFVGIEEPEAAVHPGAAGVIRDGLRTASRTTQIAITSHSPDLLDEPGIGAESILAVVSRNGETIIGPVDEAGRSAIRERLYTAGELLRMNQIEPEEAETEQLDLFAD